MHQYDIDNPHSAGSRRTAILESASRAFANFGLRGASLRDIAKDAGVSLTLLDHHFGAKASLLAAVVDAHRNACERKIAPLRASLMALDGSLTSQRLISEWVDYEFELSATRQGRHGLNMVLRLAADLEVDPEVRKNINCSERVVMTALQRLQPMLDEHQARRTWCLASAALYAAVLNLDDSRIAGDDSELLYRAETKSFLATGINGLEPNG